jgi:hypothetical protein
VLRKNGNFLTALLRLSSIETEGLLLPSAARDLLDDNQAQASGGGEGICMPTHLVLPEGAVMTDSNASSGALRGCAVLVERSPCAFTFCVINEERFAHAALDYGRRK